MKKYNQAKAEQMRLHIEACDKSGVTVNDYCTQSGLVKSNYYYWLKKLNPESRSTGFTAISLSKSSSIEVTYPNGVQLSFTGDINTTTIKALVCCI